MKRYSEERDRLEKDKEEIRSQLAKLRKEKRELKEMMMNCSGKLPLLVLFSFPGAWHKTGKHFKH